MTGPDPSDLLRAVLDPTRLAVLGAAVSGPISISSIAASTGADPKDVARAVGQLRAVGLLDQEGRLVVEVLRDIGRALPKDNEGLGTPVEGPWTEDEAATLGRFFDGGRLVRIPTSASKRRLVLEKIALAFEPGVRYAERDVNFTIQLVHSDYAALRRYLVDEGFMDRADGAYWRTGGRYDVAEAPPEVRHESLQTAIVGVELRPYDDSMVQPLVAAANDERIGRFMGDEFPYPYTRRAAEDWIHSATKRHPPTQYAVHVDGVLVGGVGGHPFAGEGTGSVEIGWWLHPEHWGRGITTAAVIVLVDEFFATRGYMRLWAPVMRGNPASARVAEKAGLTLEGTGRSHYLKRGVRIDQLHYGITRREWLSGR